MQPVDKVFSRGPGNRRNPEFFYYIKGTPRQEVDVYPSPGRETTGYRLIRGENNK